MRGLFGSLVGTERKSADNTRYGAIDEMWADFFGGNRASKAGPIINWKSALSVTTLLACGRVRGDALATVPWKLYRRREKTINGKTVVVREEARQHSLYDLLATAPNEWMTSLEFRETLSLHVDFLGHGFVFLNKVNDEIQEMILLDPARVTFKVNEDYSRTYRLAGFDGSTQSVPGDQIWHVKGPSWDTIDGLNIIQLAAEAIGLTLATEESHAAFHRNGVRPSGILSADGSLDETELVRLSAWVRRNFGGAANAGRLMVVDKAAKFYPTQMSGVDSQHIETRKFQVERLCEMMRVMPIIIGFSGDKNATFASAEQMFSAHLVHTVRPIHRRFGGSADLFLLTRRERAQGYYTGFVDADFLSPVMKDKAEYYKIALGGGGNPGWLTPADVRNFDELPYVEGADHLYCGTNMAPIGADGVPMVPSVDPAPSPKG